MKKHLDKYYKQIKNRDDQGDTPYNLRSCAYMEDFFRQKIMYSEIVQKPQFYLDNGRFFPEATTFIMTGKLLEYLLVSLNSKLLSYAFKKFYSGGCLGEKGYRYKKAFLINLPIKKIDITKNKYIEINNKITNFIKNKDFSNKELEEIIYNLYYLSKEEIEFLENNY